jgi:organic radical activating enzyme
MSTINNTTGNSSTNRLVQKLATAAAKQVLSKDQSAVVSTSATSSTPDILSAQLTSLMKKWSDAKQALDQLGNATQAINQSIKAAAAEMLKQIKEQIRMMIMLTGGDPKARARQIALLARELAVAVQEYASASGNSPQTSEASTAGSQNAATSSAEQGNSASTATNTTEVTTPSVQNVGNATPDTSPTTTSPAEATPYQPTSTHQMNEQLANKISEYNQTPSASKEDQAFALEVRKLAAQLKALAKQNEVRAHKGTDQSTERETANTYEALKEVEHGLAIIEAPSVAFTPSINIVAA